MISLKDFIIEQSNSYIKYDSKASILFVGDAMARPEQLEKAKNGSTYDFSGYYDNISEYIKSHDYSVVNLETPIHSQEYFTKKESRPIFWAPESYLDELEKAGFNLFLTANNHAQDQTKDGIMTTLWSLDQRGLDHIGTYKDTYEKILKTPFIKEINNIKIAFLNYTYKTADPKPNDGRYVNSIVDFIYIKQIEVDIKKSKEKGAEFIFVCLHWGKEHELIPGQEQKKLAKQILDFGANAIIGTHPHVIQPIIFENDKLIVYSLGNFVSCMKRNYHKAKDTKGGMIVEVNLIKDISGKVNIEDVKYRLIFTSLNNEKDNFEIKWVDDVNNKFAKDFRDEAREFLSNNNLDVIEDIPQNS
ncbi:MAG: CapA family protein [Erysipelotrichales bacterium]|nr:CapA family protein [Erysipelotrichales bacterium]